MIHNGTLPNAAVCPKSGIPDIANAAANKPGTDPMLIWKILLSVIPYYTIN
jgi:hypothetical protein